MQDQRWLIYGSTGYTGTLIANEARNRGWQPLLGGRSQALLTAQSGRMGFETRAFELGDVHSIARNLSAIDLVIHCAGPFSRTASPMLQACLESGTHYLDISGEIAVFEHVQQLNKAARDAGIVICSGAGFDVVPTDCVAACLAAALPSATHLALGFDAPRAISRGTAKTLVEALGDGGLVRRDGKLTEVKLGSLSRQIDFLEGEQLAVAIPWGDVSTAYYTTGIPNIEVYVPASPQMIKRLGQLERVRPLLRLGFVQRTLKHLANSRVRGPDADALRHGRSYFWGEVSDAEGKRVSARLRCANAYELTRHAALALAEYVLIGRPDPGVYTPALLAGKEFVTLLPGSSLITLDDELNRRHE